MWKNLLRCLVILAALKTGLFRATATAQEAETYPRDISEIRVRDPFILTDIKNGRYIMIVNMSARRKDAKGWECYTSTDLRHWQAPVPVFTPPAGFWADRDFWAPEIQAYMGKYYLFGTLSGMDKKRGTAILVADQPLGPYRPHSEGAITPHDWMALDGTLYIENGEPWMVFCHEWVQIEDGTMDAIRLTKDLSKPIGDPIKLFRASEAPWISAVKPGHYITDGPCLHRLANGTLLMLWSSNSANGYTVGIARSQSGKIEGPWKQDAKPLFEGGGHCMIFQSLEGKPILILHAPNKGSAERVKFFDVHEDADRLRLEPVAWQRG